jgi:site-specific DNA-methyltransferase (adenine-specific)/modification methylase
LVGISNFVPAQEGKETKLQLKINDEDFQTGPFVVFSDNLPMDDYYKFNKNVIDELLRVSNLVFYNVQFLTGNKPALFKLIGEYAEQIKEIIIWDKKVAQPAIGEGVMNSQFEVILVFSKESAISRKFDEAQFKRMRPRA